MVRSLYTRIMGMNVLVIWGLLIMPLNFSFSFVPGWNDCTVYIFNTLKNTFWGYFLYFMGKKHACRLKYIHKLT